MTRYTFSDFSTRLRDWIERRPESQDPGEFNELALALFQLQFHSNLPYQRYCQSQRVSREFSHWTQIPVIPMQAFKEFELTSLPAQARTSVFHSSGTTHQKTSRHFHSAESLRIYELSLLEWFKTKVGRALLRSAKKTRMIFLTPSPLEAPHSSLVHMFQILKAAFGAPDSEFLGHVDSTGAWQIDFHKAVMLLENRSGQPLFLFGTAFNFVHLLDFLAENKLQFELPRNSLVLETGGYKGRSRSIPKDELHALLQSRLGITRIITEYGMCELSSQAYDVGDGIFFFPPWARAQIVSPETGREVCEGETGLIRLFDLANVYSVMAIQSEDIAVRRGEGFELLGRAALAEQRGCSLMSLA